MNKDPGQREPRRVKHLLPRTGSGLMLLACFCALAEASAADWPQWRGDNRDGVWREEGIVESFPSNGLPLIWRASIGAGYSGPAVAGGRVYLMDRQTNAAPDTEVKTSWNFRDKTMGVERIVCLDQATGKILWVHSYPCKYSAAYGSGPRATPTVRGDRVYTLGTMGDLCCLETAAGQVVWQKNLVRDYGAKVPLYGYASQPLVNGGQLIVMVGGSGQAVVAFDRSTGKEIWKALDAVEPGYSAPLIHSLNGQRQLIVWHGEGLAGLIPETGKLLWSVAHPAYAGLAITTPSIEGNRLAVSSQYEGALMLEFKPGVAEPQVLWKASTGGSPEKVWKTKGFNTTLSSVLLQSNYFYGVSLYGEMCCLDGNTGSRVWTTLAPTSGGEQPRERWCTVFMVTYRDRVLIFNERGDLILCRLSAKGYEEISRAHILDPDMASSSGGRKVVWSHPAFANRCLYARNNHELVCVSLAAGPAKPAIKQLDPPEKDFFGKVLDFHGIPIKAHKVVVDEALYAAYSRLAMALSNQPNVLSNLAAAGAELHIIGRDQVTTDLPEWRHDKGKPIAEYNGLTRDQRTRGMGGLMTSCGEENLLKLQKDRYRGRDICLHEFAHNILQYGTGRDFYKKVQEQLKRSLEKGLWVKSYAGSNPHEYFAELTMWYFGTHGDMHMTGPKPENGREGLKKYDPEGFKLLDDFYSGRIEVQQREPRRRGNRSQ